MKIIKVYEYASCSSCKLALKFLANRRYAVERIPIFEQPPTIAELKRMLQIQGGDIKKLFNRMGVTFQEMGLTEKLPTMTEAEAFKLLSSNGRLVKRPFVLWDGGGFVGFNEAAWAKVLDK